MKFKSTIIATLLVSLLGFFGPLSAAPNINGTLDISGLSVTLDHPVGSATSGTFAPLSFGLVGAGSNGDFASLAIGSPVALTTATWTFDSASGLSGFWDVAGFNFDLSSSSISSQTPNFLNVTGVGTISAAGFADTGANFDFTITTSNSVAKIVSFAASTTSIVPEQHGSVPDTASTAIMLGLALALTLAARRHLTHLAGLVG
jgi:hypothetical protein